MIALTKVTHIFFYGGKEASERWTALKDQVAEDKRMDAETEFKTFANSFEKSSSHWQAILRSRKDCVKCVVYCCFCYRLVSGVSLLLECLSGEKWLLYTVAFGGLVIGV